VSQKLSDKAREVLEELREGISFYFQNLQKREKKSDEIRYRFSIMKFYEVMFREGRKEYNQAYENAKAKYYAFFPEEVFSVNRKS